MKKLFRIALLLCLFSIGSGGAVGPSSYVSAQTEVDLLIVGGTVVTMDGDKHLYENGFVAISGENIVDVGDAALLASKKYRAKQTIYAKGKVVMPGLINTHTHIPMTLFRGIADDLELNDWLTKYIFPAEAKNVTKDFVAAGTRLGLVEMIRGGTTTYADMYYFEDVIAEETKKAGVRGVLGETVLDFPAPDNKTWDAALTASESYVKRWHNDSLIIPAIAPHAPYTVSTQHLNDVKAFADRLNVPILIHIAEADSESEYVRKHYSARPVEYLEKIGFLSSRVTGAHMIFINDEDLATLKKREVGVAHCPQSNMKLGAGTALFPEMLKEGIRVGLGTDGAASNNDLSMWEEIDTAAKLHKIIKKNPVTVSAVQALEASTIGGARALHIEELTGSLEKGKRADVILIDFDAPHLTPVYNIYSLLAYAVKASDVSDTIINGKILMRNRKLLTLDEASIKNVARTYQKQVTKSLSK